MAQDKDYADQNAHERTPPNRPTAQPAPEHADPSAAHDHRKAGNGIDKLRYGSAGSGGAELEPGPERP